jgi:hypothetical protein
LSKEILVPMCYYSLAKVGAKKLNEKLDCMIVITSPRPSPKL